MGCDVTVCYLLRVISFYIPINVHLLKAKFQFIDITYRIYFTNGQTYIRRDLHSDACIKPSISLTL
jgi:hypothetical protein